MASGNESYTVMVESNWTLMTNELVDKLTDISCNSKSEMSLVVGESVSCCAIATFRSP